MSKYDEIRVQLIEELKKHEGQEVLDLKKFDKKFNEMFEINEPDHIIRPWFSTAAGIFVTAVNEMLLQTEENVIKILPAFPHKIDVSFKLAAKGGITVEATTKDGELKKILVCRQGVDVTDQFIIEF